MKNQEEFELLSSILSRKFGGYTLISRAAYRQVY